MTVYELIKANKSLFDFMQENKIILKNTYVYFDMVEDVRKELEKGRDFATVIKETARKYSVSGTLLKIRYNSMMREVGPLP